ncbi:hypothetical protein AVEN_82138-1 [Araneus ventricosus]|uniref:Uncharacterized protein n=1 Tax=Araneus ventricosus TaxID=182803 RepID=A0A4Y2NJU5_ARAVE|nr:hypothetical protein AVEN_19252-1 [Araneus ventricosus]GBN38287.1 hypothetical protein AVEN_158407-1 [Araneus ventricosus]GBN38687.1 hypothetical protein AVEN_166701-1 [Araneus ventricosus]GBN38711.1 hypothetical protein AVEN_82138-1 [Araneus ventricosus]
MLGYDNGMRASVILLENTPLNAAQEWQHNRLNHQTAVQICSQGARESAPAVIGNCTLDHNSRCSVCLGRRQVGCRRSPGLLLTNTRSSLAPSQNRLSSENTTDLRSVLQ